MMQLVSSIILFALLTLTVPTEANLVVNGDFTSCMGQVPYNWTGNGCACATDNYNTPVCNFATTNLGSITQLIPTIEGHYYSYSYQIEQGADAASQTYFVALWNGQIQQEIQNYPYGGMITTISNRLQATSNFTNVTFAGSGPGYWLITYVTVEPSTSTASSLSPFHPLVSKLGLLLAQVTSGEF